MPRRVFFLFLLLFIAPGGAAGLGPESAKAGGEVAGLISWLLAEERDLSGIAFSDVVAATAGVEVIPIDPESETDRRIVQGIGRALDALLLEIDDPAHSIHDVGRINEVSGHIEEILLEKLNAIDGFVCAYPQTADGRAQRSGYPDLRLLDRASGRVFYIDPKLYASGSERSAFRTFYFEPKVETNKILDAASHLIAGIAHGGRVEGRWIFLRWNLVDLHDFQVRLKAEFQASNRDLYRPEAIVATSEKEEKGEK